MTEKDREVWWQLTFDGAREKEHQNLNNAWNGTYQRNRLCHMPFAVHLDLSAFPCVATGVASPLSLDRCDPYEGYTIDNAVPCCMVANLVKGGCTDWANALVFCIQVRHWRWDGTQDYDARRLQWFETRTHPIPDRSHVQARNRLELDYSSDSDASLFDDEGGGEEGDEDSGEESDEADGAQQSGSHGQLNLPRPRFRSKSQGLLVYIPDGETEIPLLYLSSVHILDTRWVKYKLAIAPHTFHKPTIAIKKGVSQAFGHVRTPTVTPAHIPSAGTCHPYRVMALFDSKFQSRRRL